MSAARPFPTPSVPFACPDPTLHRVAEAPLRPLSDLLKAAVLFDEVADDVIASSVARIRLDALRAAVKVLS